MGTSALTTNVRGDRNTAIGFEALATMNPSGDADTNNTAVGQKALTSNTTGTQNVGIGSNAGDDVTTGDNNTLIGHNSASAGTELTTGNENTIVGANTASVNATAGSQVVVGYGLTSYGAGFITLGTGSLRTRVDGGATNWAGDSDERLKENVQTSTAGLSFINDLRPVTFDWKKKKDIPSTLAAYKEGSEERARPNSGTNNHGFIAQEIKTALDNHSEVLDGHDLWQEDSADGTQGVAPTALIPMLVKALQEADAKINALTTRIEALEG